MERGDRAVWLCGEVVAINRHDYAEHHFLHAVDGTVITGLLPDVPTQRYGSEPQRVVPLLREVGLDLREDGEPPEFPIATAFAVAARMTGVVFTPHLLNQPLLVGGSGRSRWLPRRVRATGPRERTGPAAATDVRSTPPARPVCPPAG
ncbi:DUF6461 domain-containing protein [Saccharomonospora amisosensis]|uniref:DUF6461 domain-containing protein n=1 Tax=Saccharomonospora amisosensis TaxID=1128677 RepID=UPI0036F39D8D